MLFLDHVLDNVCLRYVKFKFLSLQMRAEYASFLRDSGTVEHLLAALFRLMPENPVIQLKDSLTSASPSQKLSCVMSMFNRDPLLEITGSCFHEIFETPKHDLKCTKPIQQCSRKKLENPHNHCR